MSWSIWASLSIAEGFLVGSVGVDLDSRRIYADREVWLAGYRSGTTSRSRSTESDPARATLAAVAGDPSARLTALIERCEADPAALANRAAGDALADEVGEPLALRWRIAVVRALIAAPPDGDAVREAYGELVDRYRDDKQSLATIKALGDEIRRRETDGSLPSVLVARSNRRPKTNQP